MYIRLFKDKHKAQWGFYTSLRRLRVNFDLFEFSTSLRTRGDHPGFYFMLIVRPLLFELEITSSRHEDGSHLWDHDEEKESEST